MLVRMINAAFGPNGTLYAAGQQYDLANSLALELIGRGSAAQVNNSADNAQGTGTAGSKPPGVVPEDGKSLVLRAALAALGSNPRTKPALTFAATAFGGTPAAGAVGYSTSGAVTTGWTLYDYQLNSGTPSTKPFRVYRSAWESTSFGMRNVGYRTAAGTRVQGVGVWSVMTNAPEIVIGIPGTAGTYTFRVDGQRLSADIPTTTGVLPVSINLRGLGDGWHTVEVMLTQDDRVSYLRVPPQYQVATPAPRPVVAMLTDSLGSLVTSGRAHDSYAAFFADYMGCDVRIFAAGGTGYETAASFERFADRVPLAAAMLEARPELVIFSGGANDPGSAGFDAEVGRALAASAQQWPGVPQIVVGSFGPMTAAKYVEKAALEARMQAVAVAAGALFVPVQTDPAGAWLRGTGNTSAIAGDGPADRYIAAGDTTHWLAVGHAEIGGMLAHGVAAALQAA